MLAWLPWYEVRAAIGVSLRGWDLGLVAVLGVLLSAYAAGRVVLLRYKPQAADVPVTPGAETFVAAAAALLLTAYRVLDVPQAAGVSATRTNYLTFAALAVVAQVVFAGRKVARTGFRSTPSTLKYLTYLRLWTILFAIGEGRSPWACRSSRSPRGGRS